MTMAETEELATKWVVNYTESVSVSGGSPVETDKTYEVLASEVVGDTIVVRGTVDERATFDDKDTVVITITIKTVSEEPVNPPKTTNTLTLKGEEWAEVIEKVVVYSEDGMSTHELTAVPAPFGKTEEWTAEIPEDVKAVKIVIDGNLEKAIDKAMDDDEVTVSADELAYAQSSKIKVTIDGVVYYADNDGENKGKVTVPDMEDGTQFLAETYTSDDVTDSEKAKDGVLTIDNVSKDRVLYTACEVTLPADEPITVTLKGRTNEDGEALEAAQYVAKNETLVITFTEGGSYKIDDQKAKAYAKGETVEVKVERDVEIVTYELPTDFQANIDEAFKKVNFDVNSEENGVELTLDKETNTLSVKITDFSDLGTTTQNTGTMQFLRDLTKKDYTVSLKSGTNSISLDKGNYSTENDAMQEYKKAILGLIQNVAVAGVENTITIDITINGLNGNSVSGQVILTATIPNP